MAGARWQWWTAWAILAALVIAIAGSVDWTSALAASRGANPAWLLIAVAANTSILALAAVQWRLLLPPDAHVSGGTMFGIVAAISSMSNGGPMLAGHATGIHLIATRARVGHAAGVSVTILEQITEGVAKLAMIGAAVLMVPGFERPAIGVALAAALPVIVVALWLASRNDALADRLDARARGRWAPPARFVAGTLRHLYALGRPGRFAGATALALLSKMAEALGIGAVAAALHVPLAAWTVLAVLVAVNLASIVSVTPANLGTYEAGAFFVLRAAGVGAGEAVALALLMHAAYLVPLAGIGWVLESVRLVRRRRAAAEEVGGP